MSVEVRVGSLHALLVLVLVGQCLVRLPDAARGPSAARWLWSALAAMATDEVFVWEPVYRWADDRAGPGWGAVADIASGLLTMTAVAQILHDLRGHGRRIRVGTLVAGLTGAAACPVAWLVDPPRTVDPALRNLPVWYDTGWRSVLVWGIGLVYLAAVLIGTAVVACRGLRDVADPSVRHGMILIAAGTGIFGIGYVVAHTVVLVLWHTAPVTARLLAPWDGRLDTATEGPALALVLAGLSWAPTAARWETARIRRRVTVLRPWWTELVGQVEVMSPFRDVIAAAPRATSEELRFVQARLVVEIYDVLRNIGPDPARSRRVRALVAEAGLRNETAESATREALILLGLEDRWRGHYPAFASHPPIPDGDVATMAGCLARHARLIRRPGVRRVVDTAVREAHYHLPDAHGPHPRRA